MSFRTIVVAMATCGIALAADIPQGAHVLLRMENSINTRTAQEGDFVYLRTASPIAVNGQIIVPVGSYVQGVVSHTKRSGRVSGRAELGIRLETLTLGSGTVLKFTPHLSSVDAGDSGQKVAGQGKGLEHETRKGQDAAPIAILPGRGPAPGGMTAP